MKKYFLTPFLFLFLNVNAQNNVDLKLDNAGQSIVFGGTIFATGMIFNLSTGILIKEPKIWTYTDSREYQRDMLNYKDSKTTCKIIGTGISLIGVVAIISAGLKLTKENSKVSASVSNKGIGLCLNF